MFDGVGYSEGNRWFYSDFNLDVNSVSNKFFILFIHCMKVIS